MYLHLGNDHAVNMKDIVGIFDMENTTTSKDTKNFFVNKEKKVDVVYCTYDFPKSFVVCVNKKGEQKVYVSQLACSTLLGRAKQLQQFKQLQQLKGKGAGNSGKQ